MTKLGLVLSGGGAKGAYEVGVCKALKKLGKKPDIVTGTSIGAINGMFVVQKEINLLAHIWKNIDFSVVYEESSFAKCPDDNLIEIYKEYAKAFITEGGINVTKLEKLLAKYFNPRKFYNSKIDYGLVTYNLSKHKPEIFIKKDMSQDRVKDYIMASASCFPAFKPKKIDNNLYIDGGYYDNFPINLAIELGADEIIAVDLRAVGFKRKTENKGIPITVIAPKNKIVSFLVFDKKQSRKAIKFGYNDTLKKFGKLDGNYFSFKKGQLSKNYQKYREKMLVNMKFFLKGNDNLIIDKILKTPFIKNLMHNKLTYKNFNGIVENAGKIFQLEESKVYFINYYNYLLLKHIKNVSPFTINDIDIKNIDKFLPKEKIVKMFLNYIMADDVNSVLKYVPLFLSEFLIAIYIYTIKK